MSEGCPEPQPSALIYVNDQQPDIARKRLKRGFRYFDSAGKIITDPQALARITALTIPPAYEQVWICLLGAYGTWQSQSGVQHLTVGRLIDLTPMLGDLETSSREFH